MMQRGFKCRDGRRVPFAHIQDADPRKDGVRVRLITTSEEFAYEVYIGPTDTPAFLAAFDAYLGIGGADRDENSDFPAIRSVVDVLATFAPGRSSTTEVTTRHGVVLARYCDGVIGDWEPWQAIGTPAPDLDVEAVNAALREIHGGER